MLKNTLSLLTQALLATVLVAATQSLTAQVGVRHLTYPDVTSLSKGKVKNMHSFEAPAQATIHLDDLTLRIPDTGTVFTFEFQTDWRKEGEHLYSIGMVDATGWQWVATFDTQNGSLVLSDGTKWKYRYSVDALSEQLP